MGWSAIATRADGQQLSTDFIDDQVELRNPQFRAEFHSARDRVAGRVGGYDVGIPYGHLHTRGAGRVLSLLAGNGGSLVNMDKFDLPAVINLRHATYMLDYKFALNQLKAMGLDPEEDLLDVGFWSAIEFVRSCAKLGLGIECKRC